MSPASQGNIGKRLVAAAVIIVALGIVAIVVSLSLRSTDERADEPSTQRVDCVAISDPTEQAACLRSLGLACEPEPAVRRADPPTGSPPRFQVGVVMRSCEKNDRLAAATLKPKVVRFEFDARRPHSADHWIDFYRGLGATPQPLAGFDRVPSTAQVDALASWARSKAGRIRLLEFGNEDSFTYRHGDEPGDASYQARARGYGAAVRRLGRALAGSGVGVLAQADDGGTNSSVWVDQMFAAAPDLQRWVAGWTVHPYGPSGADKVRTALAQLEARGVESASIYCTELGIATDDGRPLSDNYGWPVALTYAAAATRLNAAVVELRGLPQVRQVLLYQSTDQKPTGESQNREAYFGLLQTDAVTPKGELTRAAIELLAGRGDASG